MASKAFAGRGSKLERGDGMTPTEVFTAIAELSKISRTGSKADLADVTNMDSGNYREFLPTLLDAGEISFEGNCIPNDTTQGTLQADFDGQVLHNWKIILPAGGTFTVSQGTWAFKAYVSAIDYDIEVSKQATVSGKLKVTGSVSFTTGS